MELPESALSADNFVPSADCADNANYAGRCSAAIRPNGLRLATAWQFACHARQQEWPTRHRFAPCSGMGGAAIPTPPVLACAELWCLPGLTCTSSAKRRFPTRQVCSKWLGRPGLEHL